MIPLETNTKFLRRFRLATAILIVSTTVVTYLLTAKLKIAFSILAGGALALANFRSIEREVRGIVEAITSGIASAQAARGYLMKFYLRLTATAIALYFLIKWKIVHPLPFIVGISLVIVNILLCALTEIGRNFWLKLKEG